MSYRSGTRVTNDKGHVTAQYADAAGGTLAAIGAAGVATRYAQDGAASSRA